MIIYQNGKDGVDRQVYDPYQAIKVLLDLHIPITDSHLQLHNSERQMIALKKSIGNVMLMVPFTKLVRAMIRHCNSCAKFT